MGKTKTLTTTSHRQVRGWEDVNTPIKRLCFASDDYDSVPEHLTALANWLVKNPEWHLDTVVVTLDDDGDFTTAAVYGPMDIPDDWEPYSSSTITDVTRIEQEVLHD